MRVVVTGGTGFVGRQIVRQLQSAGHAVRVLSRDRPPPEAGVEFVRGSVLEFAGLPAVFARSQAVIHLVGIISEMGRQTFERVHTMGTANVVNAARTAGLTRFLHMSALGTRPNAVSRYHRSKWEAEEIVRRSGFSWTIFRPGLIYGPGDRFVNLFARLSRWSPVLPVFGSGMNKMQPVAVEDVARCFVGALEAPVSVGRTYDVCGRERLSLTAVLEAISSVTGRRRFPIRIPMSLARLQAAALEAVVPALCGVASPLNRDQLLMLQEDNVGNPESACRTFGLEAVPFRAGIARFLTSPEVRASVPSVKSPR